MSGLKKIEEVALRAVRLFENIEFTVQGALLIAEEDYYSTGEEKNDDDCADLARTNGEDIVYLFPELEVVNYYCHRHKYSVTELKLK